MLIRSQDKKALIDMNGLIIRVVVEEPFQHEPINPYIEAYGTNSADFSETLGAYSTREKALKVLDMIQKAYAIYKSNEIVNTGLTATAYIGGYDTKESIIHGVKVLKEYAETLEDMIIFQMPEDIEVEV